MTEQDSIFDSNLLTFLEIKTNIPLVFSLKYKMNFVLKTKYTPGGFFYIHVV